MFPKNYVCGVTTETKKSLEQKEEDKKKKVSENVYLPLLRTFGNIQDLERSLGYLVVVPTVGTANDVS